MKKYSAVIIDDEDVHVSVLRKELARYSNVQVVGDAFIPSKGKKIVIDKRPDLLFLDVELPGGTGLEMLCDLREQITWPMQVVFYTAYEKYLLEALRASAFDFLLKPFEREELDTVMTRFFDEKQKECSQPSFSSSLAQLIPTGTSFMVGTICGFQILRLEQIGFFSYLNDRKQWVVHLSDRTCQMLKRNTCSKDILKYSSNFVQISQHKIINIAYLSMIEDKQCRLFPPFDWADDLCVSRFYYGALHDKFSLI